MHEHQLSNWKGSGLGVHGSRDLCVELMYSRSSCHFSEFILCQALSFGFYMNYLFFFKSPQKSQQDRYYHPGCTDEETEAQINSSGKLPRKKV